MAKKKVKSTKYSAEAITLLCIQFCNKKNISSQEMSLSVIECIRNNRKYATLKLCLLVSKYGTAADKKKLQKIWKYCE
ncbi:MAG: hypothetical protein ACP5OG_02385 [Candidatus Nanoarchaeia archaeon]